MEKIKQEYDLAKKAVSKFSARWNDFLDLAYAKIPDPKGFKSRVSTGDLSNLIIERNARVAARIPTGKIIPLKESDNQKSAVLNLVWNNYILQRADWQYPMSVKLRMWDYYSLVYGVSVMFHGYRADSSYTGPDCRLVDLRFVFPQAGKLSPNDAEYVFYETFHSPKDLKSMIGKSGWDSKALKSLLENSKKHNTDSSQITSTQTARGEDENLNHGQIKLITKYQKGKGAPWITFTEDGDIVREIKNPFKSGRIPFVFKMAFPLIDSFWGLGDVERGESLQRAINSITNLSLDYLKILIFPPTMMNKTMNVSKFPLKPGALWRINKQDGEFVETANLNQVPTNIVQQLNQGLKGALLNQNGTTDTTITASDGLPGFGKTPDALKKLDARESSRDNFDRQMYEAACKELFEGMLEELGSRQKLPIVFEIFEKEIAELQAEGLGALVGGDDPKSYAQITITPKDLEGGHKFLMDVGSSAENDKNEEFERIKSVVDMIESPFGQKALEEMAKHNYTIDFKLVFEQYLAAANIKNREKIIIQSLEQPQPEKPKDDYSEDFDANSITDPNLLKIIQGN